MRTLNQKEISMLRMAADPDDTKFKVWSGDFILMAIRLCKEGYLRYEGIPTGVRLDITDKGLEAMKEMAS